MASNRPAYIAIISCAYFLLGISLFLLGARLLLEPGNAVPFFIVLIGILNIIAGLGMWYGRYFGFLLAGTVIFFQISVDAFKTIYWSIHGYPEYFNWLKLWQRYALYLIWLLFLVTILRLLFTKRNLHFFEIIHRKRLGEFLKMVAAGLSLFGLLFAIAGTG